MLSADRIDTIMGVAVETVAPAAALAVYHRGALVLERAWGVVDPETGAVPVTPDTLFDLASLTKLYTASAFFALASREKLPLTTPLVELVPEFGAGGARPIDGGQDPHSKQPLPTPPHLAGQTVDPAGVTLWHLLTHTSGLPPWRDVYSVAPPPPPPDQPDPVAPGERWARALARMCGYPFVDHVGAAVRYSDIGLMLLGEAAARLHGGDLAAAVNAHVLEPLNLAETRFNPVRDGGLPFNRIAPTELDPTWRGRRVWGEVHDENACGVGGAAGHAGLFAPVGEVARLGLAWLRRDGLALSPALWRDAVREQAVTDGERRGLGWMLRSYAGSSAGDLMSAGAFGHTGFTGTSLWIDPEHELAAALLTNRVYPGRERVGIHQLRRAVHDAVVEALP